VSQLALMSTIVREFAADIIHYSLLKDFQYSALI